MRPTNSSTGSVAEVEVAQRGAGAGAVAGREEGVVDAGRHELDAARVGAVEAHELVGLGPARGEDGVGAADDLGLGPHPALGLGVAGLGLHPGERVEGRHQRQVELVLQAVAGDARQPVVGVEGVDVAQLLEVLAHAVGEVVDDVRAAAPWRGRGGPASTWTTRNPGSTSTTSGDVGVPAAGEHVGLHARLGQGRHQLADVDVHAPAVALPGLGERRRVQREDGEAAHRGDRRRSTLGVDEFFLAAGTNRRAFSWRNDV